MGMITRRSMQSHGPPSWSASHSTCRPWSDDVAEMQRFYISNGLKKPNWVSIRDFFHRIQHLNRYLDLLSCLYYSSMASKSMKIIGPFDDANLASHILKMVTRTWQDQYELNGAMVPQSVRKLLEALKRIEKPFQPIRIVKGPRATLNQVTLPRGR